MDNLNKLSNNFFYFKMNIDINMLKIEFKMNSTIHFDIIYNILLHSNIYDLEYQCQINNSSKQICYNNQFWYDYFQLHQLPYDQFLHPYQYINSFKIKYIKKYYHETHYDNKQLYENDIVMNYLLKNYIYLLKNKEIYPNRPTIKLTQYINIYKLCDDYWELNYSIIYGKYNTYVNLLFALTNNEIYKCMYDLIYFYNINLIPSY